MGNVAKLVLLMHLHAYEATERFITRSVQYGRAYRSEGGEEVRSEGPGTSRLTLGTP